MRPRCVTHPPTCVIDLESNTVGECESVSSMDNKTAIIDIDVNDTNPPTCVPDLEFSAVGECESVTTMDTSMRLSKVSLPAVTWFSFLYW